VKSFSGEYIGALLWDIEVHISNPDSLTANALFSSIEEANKKQFWMLHQQSRLPTSSSAAEKVQSTHISSRKIILYNNDMNEPTISPIFYDHPHAMEKAIPILHQL
jgi:hypothetical protein